MQSTILVYVNDLPLYVPPSSTVIIACEKLGLTIPRFCYHDLLEIAGNCRICLVEIEKSPKPQVSCGLPVFDNIRIYTNTPLVKKAREGVLEFLLLNHPLDCPICDQGGECDLQNQALKYGSTRSRFYNFKRGVEDKGLGPIIKTVITRCIHCTRCVRFAWDIAGVEDLGICLRGNNSEVGTYVRKTFNSEVSGNVIDLCPVGALTSKVHAFKTRPWEVKTTLSIDTSDSLGSNIIIETKGSRPIRILPRNNKKINDEWLSDKGRFIYEGYISIRLAYIYFAKNKKHYQFSSLSKTKKSLENFFKKTEHLKLLIGRNLDLENIIKGINLCKRLGYYYNSETHFNILPTIPGYFQSTVSLNTIYQADSCLLLGLNPRSEATIANLKLRSRFKKGLFNVLNFGNPVDLTYSSSCLGLQLLHLYILILGKHKKNLIFTHKPLFVYGDTLSQRNDGFSGLNLAYAFVKVKQSKSWNSIFRFPLGSNSVGKAFSGLAKQCLKYFEETSETVNYYFGAQNNKAYKNKTKNNKYIVETTHVNTDFKNCAFVLPLQSVLEKDGSFINCNGLIQKNLRVLRFGIKPLAFLESYAYLQSSSICRSKMIFNSIASYKLIIIGIITKIKVFTTPLKALLGDIYRTDLCTSSSLTLYKISSNYRKHYMSFIFG